MQANLIFLAILIVLAAYSVVSILRYGIQSWRYADSYFDLMLHARPERCPACGGRFSQSGEHVISQG